MLRRGLSTHPSPPHHFLRAPPPVCRELHVGALQNATARPTSQLSAAAERDRLSSTAARAYSVSSLSFLVIHGSLHADPFNAILLLACIVLVHSFAAISG